MSIQIGEPPSEIAARGFAFFALGFRPFFLFAGFSAVILLALWLLIWQGKLPATGYFDALQWHAHEMLFGYAASVVAGFLLTAVRNWTGMAVPIKGKLAGLAVVWLSARLLILMPGVPDVLVALVDLLFIPLVGLSLFRPLWFGQNKTNRYFLLLFASMTFANLLFHLDVMGVMPGLWQRGSYFMLDTVLLTLLLVAGRVMPFFTEKAVAGSNPKSSPWVEKSGFVLLILMATAQLLMPYSALAGLLALMLALLQAIRLAGWHHLGVWRTPVLWVLYTGYAWMVIGLVLRGLSSFGLVSPQLGLHGLTAGAVGVLTLGMMSRVALGHTGRDINTSTLSNLAFVLVNIGAVFRVILPMLSPDQYSIWINISGGLWVLGFSLFVMVYTSILIRPRIDGRPG
jgi:uncharacterized protein involved in response to NO